MNMTKAQILLEKITSAIDRQSIAICSPDVKTVKILVRINDGKVEEPEISIDFKRQPIANTRHS